MFTGIVRDVGRVVSFDSTRLIIETTVEGSVGDSIAVDGICLTVVAPDDGRLAFDVTPETLGRIKPFGAEVNVEPPLRAGDPLGGHYVQGHVDAVGRIQAVEADGVSLRVFVEAPREVLRYCIEKGSIAVDGVSLTVAEVSEDAFAVALVPHTLSATTLSTLGPGQEVNLEADVLAKYAARALESRGD